MGTAVLAGETEVAELLLAHGADPNGTSRFGLPSLHLAAAVGNGAVVRVLLESGVDVNKQGKNGESALHWAAAKGHNDIVQLLVSIRIERKVINSYVITIVCCCTSGI